MQSIIRSS